MKPPAGVQLRPMAAGQWPGVERIYRQDVAGGLATFESAVPSREDFSARKIAQLGLAAVHRDSTVIGWIAASPVSARRAFRGVIEHSVYVDAAQAGLGVGTALPGVLGYRERSAQAPAGPLSGRWIDTVLYELRLEPGAATHT